MRELIKKLAPKAALNGYKAIRKKLIKTEFGLFHHFPIKKKRVVLCNVWGFGDNTKWIAKALRNSDKSVEVVFVTDRSKADRVPEGIRVLETNSPKAIYYLATAHVWVDCNRKEPYILKKKGQIYIQTWHGSIPLKRLEADYPELTEDYMANAARDSQMTDLCLSNGEFMNDIYRTAFGYECECIVTGSARLDPLLKPNAKRVLKTKTRIAELAGIKDTGNSNNLRIAVYAPTYRENGAGIEFPDLGQVLKSLEKRFGGSFVIVERVHPLVRGKDNNYRSEQSKEKKSPMHKNDTSGIVDGNGLGDLYELLEASDVLITDYSNTMFEFAMAGRPVFLYAPDSKEYEEERGFYFDYNRLPYPHSSTTGDLCDEIEGYSAFDHKNELDEFFKNLGVREDGKASKRIADMILRKVYRE